MRGRFPGGAEVNLTVPLIGCYSHLKFARLEMVELLEIVVVAVAAAVVLVVVVEHYIPPAPYLPSHRHAKNPPAAPDP